MKQRKDYDNIKGIAKMLSKRDKCDYIICETTKGYGYVRQNKEKTLHGLETIKYEETKNKTEKIPVKKVKKDQPKKDKGSDKLPTTEGKDVL